MPNSGRGGCPGTRFMTICGSHVQLHISNIGYMRVYEGLQALEGIYFFFLVKFHVECRQNHVWGPPGARVMTNFVKHVFYNNTQ